MGMLTDPVVDLVPVHGLLGGPGRAAPRDDSRPDDFHVPGPDALDDVLHPGDQLVGVDEPAVKIVRALEEDDVADPGSREDVAVQPFHRGGVP